MPVDMNADLDFCALFELTEELDVSTLGAVLGYSVKS